MRKILLAAAAFGALTALTACGGGYGYRQAAVVGVAGDGVYYDDFYGPYAEGYWGPDQYFYYRGGDGRFIRDDARHFRRESFGSAHMVRARPYDRDHDGDRGHDRDRDHDGDRR